MAGLAAGFALVHRMERRLLFDVGTDAEAVQTVRQHALPAFAAVEVPALTASLPAFLTGDVLTLAFAAPLGAFAALLWPSDARLARWSSLRHR